MKQHWPRWIKTSIYKHFDDLKGDYTLYLDPLERESLEAITRFELRINGPDIQELNKDYFRIEVDINLLVRYSINKADTTYAHEVMIGQGLLSFTNNITIKKYGSGDDDDSSIVLGCLEIRTPADVTNFGNVEIGSNVLHSTIDAEYRMYLRGA